MPKSKTQPKGKPMEPALVPVVSLKRHMYDQRWRNPGDEYNARHDMVRTLVATGFAKPVEEEPTGEANRYRRRDMRAKD
jgi:hypothetical protein